MDKMATKKIALASLIVLVLIGGGVGAYYYKKHHPKEAPKTAHEQAVDLYGDKKYDQALAKVQESVSAQPTNADNYNFKANILRDKGDTAGAEENYNKSIELNPKFLSPYTNEANMLLNLGEKEKAAAIINKGLVEFPGQKTLTELLEQTK